MIRGIRLVSDGKSSSDLTIPGEYIGQFLILVYESIVFIIILLAFIATRKISF